MSRPVWFVNLTKKLFPARFLAASATNLPLIGPLVDQMLFENDDLVYLTRNKAFQINEDIEVGEEFVLPSQIVTHFVEQASVHWIMNECICRGADDCKDYPVDLGCLFLGEAAEGINPELGRRVTVDEAREHAHRAQAAGTVHMIGRNKLDTVWLGVGPGTKLLTICNCCPCCCMWKMIPQVNPLISTKVNRMPGVTIQVSEDCSGCEICLNGVCFVDAISMNGGAATIGDSCRGCGNCVILCPEEAIKISISDHTFVEETISHIAPLVEVS
jgi:ferredoxin